MSRNHLSRKIGVGLFALALAALACSAPSASDSPTTAPTTPAATPESTSTPAIPPAPALHHVILQNKDLSLSTFGVDGQSVPFGRADFRLGAGSYADFAVAGTKLYAMSGYDTPDKPPRFYVIDSSGAQPLPLKPSQPQGFAAWPGSDQQPARLAWGEADWQNPTVLPTQPDAAEAPFPTIATRLLSADVTAANGRIIYQATSDKGLYLAPMRWSPDGRHLFYSMEPTGLGGYILFGGRSSLYDLDDTTGQSTELIPFSPESGAICLDGLSLDFTLIGSHCDKQISVINLQTRARTVISPPAGVPLDQIGQEGNVTFSPDGRRVAFAMAHGDPENEQGWVAVTDDLSGSSRLVATSPARSYYNVLGWLDETHLLLAMGSVSGDSWFTIQILTLDGTPPRDFAPESQFVTFAP